MFLDIRWLPQEGWLCAVEGGFGRVALTAIGVQLTLSHFRDAGVGTPAGFQQFWIVAVSLRRPHFRGAKGLMNPFEKGEDLM
ncbi:MAG: hypothetical protein Q8R28_11440 [Dehalococcoidia bacterium]|nr:hypothetical protein [Dehalococcoidia bacterium]